MREIPITEPATYQNIADAVAACEKQGWKPKRIKIGLEGAKAILKDSLLFGIGLEFDPEHEGPGFVEPTEYTQFDSCPVCGRMAGCAHTRAARG